MDQSLESAAKMGLDVPYLVDALNLTVDGANIGFQTIRDEAAKFSTAVFNTNLC